MTFHAKHNEPVENIPFSTAKSNQLTNNNNNFVNKSPGMSIQLGQLCSAIVEQQFGTVVQRVADDIFSSIWKPLVSIIKSTKLSRTEVCTALAILVKFRLVKYRQNKNKETVAEYALLPENVLLVLRYSRYMCHTQSKFGHEAALLVEELLRNGMDTASNIIQRSVANNSEEKAAAVDKKVILKHRDKIVELIEKMYLIRAPAPQPFENESGEVPILIVDVPSLFTPPDIDIKRLISGVEGQKFDKANDFNIFWMLNFERFHQDFRDELLRSAIESKIDSSAAECLQFLLQLMYTKTDPWQPSSSPIGYHEIKGTCEKNSENKTLVRHVEQYIQVLESDSLDIISRCTEVGGGQFVVQVKEAIDQLVWHCLENVIEEKYGAKALRIFRVIRLKKYIEQDELQKEVMVPSKEAKHLTYRLLADNFIEMAVVKKAGGGGMGPAKNFFMFHVNQSQLAMMTLETCYKALFNSITRAKFDAKMNARLIDKALRVESTAEAMKERGESEEYIAELMETLTPPEREILGKVKARLKNLYSAEIGLDETMFLLQLYQRYRLPAHLASTNK